MSALPYVYEGEGVWRAKRGFAKRADAEYVIGQDYLLEPIEHRSAATHRHYFASIADAWSNLPEHLAERFQNPEALRKYALIRAGYADQRQIVAASKAEAQRLATFIRPMDEYALVTVTEAVVTVYTARSQSMRSMGKNDFAESKERVLSIVAGMIGAKPEELGRAA